MRTDAGVTSPPTALLRAALEAAMQVARAGEAADPVEPAPAALRRYLNFARLPAPALDIARRVLDDDESFRRRVAAATTEAQVGEAGWVWLTRPEGWQARLEELRKVQQQLEHAAHEEKVEREAQRRLAGAEDRARRAEVALTAATRDLDDARNALADERALRRQAEAELHNIASTIEELRAQRNAAVRQLKDVEAELAQRTADLRHARHEIRMREAELEAAARAPAGRHAARAGDAPATVTPATSAPPVAAAPAAPVAPSAAGAGAPASSAALAQLVADAAAGAERLSASLAAAAALLAPGDTPAHDAPAAAAKPTATAARPLPRRVPLPIPGGLAEDSADAAEHLLRTPNALLLVDGYNVSHAIWWDQPIATQRDRLVDALAELHARTGADVHVVFDGADVERTGALSSRGVQVRFSSPGVEADDVIIEQVRTLPANRPVLVASSDRRVRDAVRRQGANLLGARQLADALRR